MGVMLSVLIFSVGVIEALSCLDHFRRGYVPLRVARRRTTAKPVAELRSKSPPRSSQTITESAPPPLSPELKSVNRPGIVPENISLPHSIVEDNDEESSVKETVTGDDVQFFKCFKKQISNSDFDLPEQEPAVERSGNDVVGEVPLESDVKFFQCFQKQISGSEFERDDVSRFDLEPAPIRERPIEEVVEMEEVENISFGPNEALESGPTEPEIVSTPLSGVGERKRDSNVEYDKECDEHTFGLIEEARPLHPPGEIDDLVADILDISKQSPSLVSESVKSAELGSLDNPIREAEIIHCTTSSLLPISSLEYSSISAGNDEKVEILDVLDGGADHEIIHHPEETIEKDNKMEDFSKPDDGIQSMLEEEALISSIEKQIDTSFGTDPSELYNAPLDESTGDEVGPQEVLSGVDDENVEAEVIDNLEHDVLVTERGKFSEDISNQESTSITTKENELEEPESEVEISAEEEQLFEVNEKPELKTMAVVFSTEVIEPSEVDCNPNEAIRWETEEKHVQFISADKTPDTSGDEESLEHKLIEVTVFHKETGFPERALVCEKTEFIGLKEEKSPVLLTLTDVTSMEIESPPVEDISSMTTGKEIDSSEDLEPCGGMKILIDCKGSLDDIVGHSTSEGSPVERTPVPLRKNVEIPSEASELPESSELCVTKGVLNVEDECQAESVEPGEESIREEELAAGSGPLREEVNSVHVEGTQAEILDVGKGPDVLGNDVQEVSSEEEIVYDSEEISEEEEGCFETEGVESIPKSHVQPYNDLTSSNVKVSLVEGTKSVSEEHSKDKHSTGLDNMSTTWPADLPHTVISHRRNEDAEIYNEEEEEVEDDYMSEEKCDVQMDIKSNFNEACTIAQPPLFNIPPNEVHADVGIDVEISSEEEVEVDDLSKEKFPINIEASATGQLSVVDPIPEEVCTKEADIIDVEISSEEENVEDGCVNKENLEIRSIVKLNPTEEPTSVKPLILKLPQNEAVWGAEDDIDVEEEVMEEEVMEEEELEIEEDDTELRAISASSTNLENVKITEDKLIPGVCGQSESPLDNSLIEDKLAHSTPPADSKTIKEDSTIRLSEIISTGDIRLCEAKEVIHLEAEELAHPAEVGENQKELIEIGQYAKVGIRDDISAEVQEEVVSSNEEEEESDCEVEEKSLREADKNVLQSTSEVTVEHPPGGMKGSGSELHSEQSVIHMRSSIDEGDSEDTIKVDPAATPKGVDPSPDKAFWVRDPRHDE